MSTLSDAGAKQAAALLDAALKAGGSEAAAANSDLIQDLLGHPASSEAVAASVVANVVPTTSPVTEPSTPQPSPVPAVAAKLTFPAKASGLGRVPAARPAAPAASAPADPKVLEREAALNLAHRVNAPPHAVKK